LPIEIVNAQIRRALKPDEPQIDAMLGQELPELVLKRSIAVVRLLVPDISHECLQLRGSRCGGLSHTHRSTIVGLTRPPRLDPQPGVYTPDYTMAPLSGLDGDALAMWHGLPTRRLHAGLYDGAPLGARWWWVGHVARSPNPAFTRRAI
jgi:hypothetical protein